MAVSVTVSLPFFVVVLLCGLTGNALGVTLSSCGSDKTAEVIQGEAVNTFTCTGLANGQQVDWTLIHNLIEYTGATCPPVSPGGSCSRGELGSVFTASQVSNTESRVVIDPTVLNRKEFIQDGTLKCKDNSNSDMCQMDYIVPVNGGCSIQLGTGTSRFKLDGKCTLQAGAKSSRNRFKCVWTRTSGTSWQHPVSLAENTYLTGCVLTTELPTDTGQYTYNVQLFPGRRTVAAAGTIQITRPEAPTVSGCGGETYIPENTTVTCTCNANGTGQPAGRLQWVKVGDKNVQQQGNYGETHLRVSQNLLRTDHQSTQFRCNVQWAEDITGTPVMFNVGYPPTEVFLGINQAQSNQTVSEHQSVDFRCQNSNGRPESTLTLMKKSNNTELLRKLSFLNHVVVSRCEDSGEYTCTADNGMGPKFTGIARSLFVQCSPRGTNDVGSVNFINKPVSTTFDITAYPVPSAVKFAYLGPAGNNTEPTAVEESQIELTGSCAAKGGVAYQSTCMVTVTNVTTDTAAGFYLVTITNTQGSGQFRLQVLYKAPTPDGGDKGRQEEETNIGGIVGGVVSAVVAITIVIIIIVVVMKKRKDPAKEKFASAGPTAANGGQAAFHGELDNPAHEPDPQPHSRSDVEAPQAVEAAYAVMNKPKKLTGAAAASAEGAPEAGGSVYAVVDKMKKKNAAPAKPADKAKKGPQAKPRKEKGKKSGKDMEVHVYGNVEPVTKEDKRKKGKKPPAMPMEEKGGGGGKVVNAEGLTYMEVDFTGLATSSEPPPKPSPTDQGVLYSVVDFAKTSHT